jgi:acyl-CoA hydrolase
MSLPGRPPSASSLSLSQIMDQHDTNLMGTVHGGHILKLVDSAAGVVASRHCDGHAVTAAMDETLFLQAIRVGDVVHVDARITWAGRSSMEVAIKVSADRWDKAVPRTLVATSHMVMVAVDEDGKPRAVPPVLPETPEDHTAFREAEIRRRHRLALREELAAQAESFVQ